MTPPNPSPAQVPNWEGWGPYFPGSHPPSMGGGGVRRSDAALPRWQITQTRFWCLSSSSSKISLDFSGKGLDGEEVGSPRQSPQAATAPQQLFPARTEGKYGPSEGVRCCATVLCAGEHPERIVCRLIPQILFLLLQKTSLLNTVLLRSGALFDRAVKTHRTCLVSFFFF